MKKTMLLIAAVLFCSAAVVSAQNEQTTKDNTKDNNKGVFISTTWGIVASENENCWSYFSEGQWRMLFSGGGDFQIGYSFNPHIAARLEAGFARNFSGGNIKETSAGIFRPYTFQSITAFGDFMYTFGDEDWAVKPRAFAGIGLGHGYNPTDNGHPWQHPEAYFPTNALGGRIGIMAEHIRPYGVGVFVQLAQEFYGDKFNGLDAGFPLDLRTTLKLGISYHF